MYPAIEVRTTVVGATRMVAVKGEIDIASCRQIQAATRAAIDARPAAVVLDLAAVDFCDSTGIRMVLETHEHARAADVGFVVARPLGDAWRAFQIAGVDGLLKFIGPDEPTD